MPAEVYPDFTMDPRKIRITDYSYELPENKIAKFPLADRDQSKLLIYKGNTISEDIYKNITAYLPEGSMLVFNNSRVINARVLFKKPTGGQVEIFLLEPNSQDAGLQDLMHIKGKVRCRCLIGGAGKWKHHQVLETQVLENGTAIILRAQIVERSADDFTVEFFWEPDDFSFSEMLHRFGSTPIPPYLKRVSAFSDQERYQTIYAQAEGSVAAPTAGLHFTENVFNALKLKNIQCEFITLHVGAGTFLPVKSETISGHTMHAECLEINKAFLIKLAGQQQGIFAVGTTSLRTLESIYWMGVKCSLHPSIDKEALQISQWEVYDQLESPPMAVNIALSSLLSWMEKNSLEVLTVKTSILIAPPYRPKLIHGLITNFHQPGSTLLLLVAAMIGKEWVTVYEYALEHDFRFLSYGDGCLFFT